MNMEIRLVPKSSRFLRDTNVLSNNLLQESGYGHTQGAPEGEL